METKIDNSDKKLNISDVVVIILCLLPVFGMHFVVYFNKLDWYEKNSSAYTYWYVLSSMTVLLYVVFS